MYYRSHTGKLFTNFDQCSAGRFFCLTQTALGLAVGDREWSAQFVSHAGGQPADGSELFVLPQLSLKLVFILPASVDFLLRRRYSVQHGVDALAQMTDFR